MIRSKSLFKNNVLIQCFLMIIRTSLEEVKQMVKA